MLRLEMLPAGRGDCIWMEYGDPLSPCRVLIDGGVRSTGALLRARIEALPRDQRHFELVVITHIDLDHIAGVLSLMDDPPAGFSVGDVWFNGWKHLPEDSGLLGVKQAEALSRVLEQAHGMRWNQSFGGEAVVIPDTGDLPQLTLPGGMSMTLLSPTRERLRRLRNVWHKAIQAQEQPDRPGHPEDDRDSGWFLGGSLPNIDALAAEPFRPDSSAANGSSIALIAEFDGRRCLFAGDAFADDVLDALNRLRRTQGGSPVVLDAFKLAHHGGSKNTSSELLSAVFCRNYLISTDGSVYGHPDQESVARVIVHGRSAGRPCLIFNYLSDENLVWTDHRILRDKRYEVHYPPKGASGMVLDL